VPAGPGRFTHSAVQQTIAPWDGHAVRLVLAEGPVEEGKIPGPYVSICVYQGTNELQGQRVSLAGKESRAGVANLITNGGGAPLTAAAVTFEKLHPGEPATGTYDVTLPDGKRERGHFTADWWPAEGRGG
jgi:hypothetical protein